MFIIIIIIIIINIIIIIIIIIIIWDLDFRGPFFESDSHKQM
jgi:hypothetical protein